MWVAAISLRQLGFVIFQTGDPNASSYGIQILYGIPRVEPRPGLAQEKSSCCLFVCLFFQVRVIAGVHRPWGTFNVASISAGATESWGRT